MFQTEFNLNSFNSLKIFHLIHLYRWKKAEYLAIWILFWNSKIINTGAVTHNSFHYNTICCFWRGKRNWLLLTYLPFCISFTAMTHCTLTFSFLLSIGHQFSVSVGLCSKSIRIFVVVVPIFFFNSVKITSVW